MNYNFRGKNVKDIEIPTETLIFSTNLINITKNKVHGPSPLNVKEQLEIQSLDNILEQKK